MENKLVEKLKWCKRELAGLKIACERGVGVVDFYSNTTSQLMLFQPSTPALRITVQFADVNYQPYCQCYLSNTQYFQPARISYDDTTNTLTCIYLCFVTNVTINVSVKAIASAAIDSVTLEAIPYA